MLNDMIADSITRIRNAYLRRQDVTTLLHSKTIENVLKIFQEKGYIESYSVKEEANNKKSLNVVLKYNDNGKPVMNEVARVSKPGRRVYKGSNDLKNFKNGYGTMVISTSKGVLSNEDAFRLGVGGEVLCSIW
jgi:small subunit ribosomal protein S8